MKILYINPIQYDYLAATLIEGLTDLGHEIVCSRASSYGRAIPAPEIAAYAESADLIISGSGNADHYLLEGVRNPRIVAVDGSDHASYDVSGVTRVKAIFKREISILDTQAQSRFIFPLPFAAEKRYMTNIPEKDLLVSFVASMHTNPIRNSIHMRLLNRNDPGIFSGSTKERAYSEGTPSATAIETPSYRTMLARSRISVSVPGAGYDCARYWEILAAKAMLFTYTPDIAIPMAFTDGVNCATFSSFREFEEKLDYYLNHPERVAEIAELGHCHLLSYHTTAHRARYFLELAVRSAGRSDFCDTMFSKHYAPVTRWDRLGKKRSISIVKSVAKALLQR